MSTIFSTYPSVMWDSHVAIHVTQATISSQNLSAPKVVTRLCQTAPHSAFLNAWHQPFPFGLYGLFTAYK